MKAADVLRNLESVIESIPKATGTKEIKKILELHAYYLDEIAMQMERDLLKASGFLEGGNE